MYHGDLVDDEHVHHAPRDLGSTETPSDVIRYAVDTEPKSQKAMNRFAADVHRSDAGWC